jgi:hypothetical protein
LEEENYRVCRIFRVPVFILGKPHLPSHLFIASEKGKIKVRSVFLIVFLKFHRQFLFGILKVKKIFFMTPNVF